MSEIYPPLRPAPPFIWPEPRILEGKSFYETEPPFGSVVRESSSVFGIVSSLNEKGIGLLDTWLKDTPDFQATLIVAVYPTCLTHQDDLTNLVSIVDAHNEQLRIRICVHREVTDRPTNALCFWDRGSDIAHMAIGSMENFGFDLSVEGKINFVFKADPALLESFSRYFNWLWTKSREISDKDITQIPNLSLPDGSREAAQQWEEYYKLCYRASPDTIDTGEIVRVDPETGDVSISQLEGEDIPSPTENLGIPKLDRLAEIISRLYEKGMLVSIDKLSRIPPLDAPLDPRWFGDTSEIQKGNVIRKVSMRVSIIDETTLKEIDKRRQSIRTLLSKFTFGLADNMRWMPQSAKALFESEIKRVNAEGQQLITDLLQGDLDSFIEQKKNTIVAGINAMQQELGRQGSVPDDIIEKVLNSLKERLKKAQSANFMPQFSYSNIKFSTLSNEWASPWGQAFSFLHDIALFPRKALTDGFFLQGLKVSEDALIESMNVADDALFLETVKTGMKDRCKAEINTLKQLKNISSSAKDKCEFVWMILRGNQFSLIEKECVMEEEGKKQIKP